jgi:hypothetical protein
MRRIVRLVMEASCQFHLFVCVACFYCFVMRGIQGTAIVLISCVHKTQLATCYIYQNAVVFHFVTLESTCFYPLVWPM